MTVASARATDDKLEATLNGGMDELHMTSIY